jgi:beta-glucosidase
MTRPEDAAWLPAFPRDFRWGLATAAYQIEGGAAEGGRGPSIWDTFAHTPGLVKNGDTGDVACDHFHRWPADLDLLADLGVRDYRLGLSWTRLQPTGVGPLNPEGVAFYRALLGGMRDRGIRPLVTLYHWDLPQTLEDAGGWPVRQTAEHFGAYAGLVLEALGDLAGDWITLNEPWCSSFLGYGSGAHAPGRTDYRDAVAAAHHLNLAHGLALREIRRVAPDVRVGTTNLILDIVSATDSPADAVAAERLDAFHNRVFLDPVYLGSYSPAVLETLGRYGFEEHIRDGDLEIIGQPTDFAGVNHYQRVIVRADPSAPFGFADTPAEPATTSFGWSVIPDSLRSVLSRVSREFTTLPIYVTESGASYDDEVVDGAVHDLDRVAYLDGYFAAAAAAIGEGVDLRGYYVWSFLDNFEWAEGYGKRFGLVHVDYATQVRTPKDSALHYRDLISEHRSSEHRAAAIPAAT